MINKDFKNTAVPSGSNDPNNHNQFGVIGGSSASGSIDSSNNIKKNNQASIIAKNQRKGANVSNPTGSAIGPNRGDIGRNYTNGAVDIEPKHAVKNEKTEKNLMSSSSKSSKSYSPLLGAKNMVHHHHQQKPPHASSFPSNAPANYDADYNQDRHFDKPFSFGAQTSESGSSNSSSSLNQNQTASIISSFSDFNTPAGRMLRDDLRRYHTPPPPGLKHRLGTNGTTSASGSPSLPHTQQNQHAISISSGKSGRAGAHAASASSVMAGSAAYASNKQHQSAFQPGKSGASSSTGGAGFTSTSTANSSTQPSHPISHRHHHLMGDFHKSTRTPPPPSSAGSFPQKHSLSAQSSPFMGFLGVGAGPELPPLPNSHVPPAPSTKAHGFVPSLLLANTNYVDDFSSAPTDPESSAYVPLLFSSAGSGVGTSMQQPSVDFGHQNTNFSGDINDPNNIDNSADLKQFAQYIDENLEFGHNSSRNANLDGFVQDNQPVGTSAAKSENQKSPSFPSNSGIMPAGTINQPKPRQYTSSSLLLNGNLGFMNLSLNSASAAVNRNASPGSQAAIARPGSAGGLRYVSGQTSNNQASNLYQRSNFNASQASGGQDSLIQPSIKGNKRNIDGPRDGISPNVGVAGIGNIRSSSGMSGANSMAFKPDSFPQSAPNSPSFSPLSSSAGNVPRAGRHLFAQVVASSSATNSQQQGFSMKKQPHLSSTPPPSFQDYPHRMVKKSNNHATSMNLNALDVAASGNANYGESNSGNSLLESFRQIKNPAQSSKFQLSDILGHVVEFSQDQHGSRFIQQKLESSSLEVRHLVFMELMTVDESASSQNRAPTSYCLQLMTDVFGNYVVQKFLELGTTEEKQLLGEQMAGHVVPLSMQMYGCRVVQKAFDHLLPEQQRILISELAGNVLQCVKDQNGNHVVQKAIERMGVDQVGFILDAFRGQVFQLATHPYGCRVIQRIFEHCPQTTTRPLMQELRSQILPLVHDQYGNYVVQHILDKGTMDDRMNVLTSVRKDFSNLSRHKFASNVMEKCISRCSSTDLHEIINSLLVSSASGHGEQVDSQSEAVIGQVPLVMMMRDAFANYVVQKIIELSSSDDIKRIVECTGSILPSLKRTGYGKHIVGKLEKVAPNLMADIFIRYGN